MTLMFELDLYAKLKAGKNASHDFFLKKKKKHIIMGFYNQRSNVLTQNYKILANSIGSMLINYAQTN